MNAALTVGVAAFAVDVAGARSSEVQPAPRVRAASVTKPLLFWAGATAEPFATGRAEWEALARPAVTVSDNEATAELWARVGEGRLLAAVHALSGVAWTAERGGEHESLCLLVTAKELAAAYASFAFDVSDAAQQLRNWMRAVPPEQTFGVRAVAGAALGIPAISIGVKCGWFGGERAHAVVIADVGARSLGAVVTTSRPWDDSSRHACELAAGDNRRLIALHESFAGSSIRLGVRRAIEVAASL
ncbi:MAG TPA: serine hydrolase [Acidimicrobiales bacterium]|nr:serine hydrolase [Acidimicrobiales bacterium]